MLTLTLGLMAPNAILPDAIQNLIMTGLADGAAVMGDHASISVPVPAGVTAWTSQQWGTSYENATYGTGPNPTTFTSGTDGTLFWEGVGDDGDTYRAAAPIRFALGIINNIADGQAWTVDDTSTTLDGSASGANLTFTYRISENPAGVTINSAGLITVAPTAVASGTITVTATDQYGRELQDTFTFTSALRTQATAADALGPFSWTVDDTVVNVDFTSDFTANGNTLGYVITGLPAGVSDDGDGSASGTPTAASSGGITISATDEYGRVTPSTPNFTTALRTQATAAGGLGPFNFTEDVAITTQNLAADFTANGNTVTYAMTSALPAGLSVSAAALMSGTPTTLTGSAPYTVRATDEYGRTTDSTFNLAVVAAGDTQAPTISNVVWDQGAGSGTADTDEGGTVYICTHMAAMPAVADGVGGWSSTTLEDFTDTIPGSGSVTINPTETAASSTADRLSFYIRDAAGNNSAVETVNYTYPAPAGPSYVKRAYVNDTLTVGGTDAATITGFFDGAGTFFVSLHDVANNNDHGYTLTGPTVTSAVALVDTTASTGSTSNRSNTFGYLVTTSGAGDLTVTITGSGSSFNRVLAQTQVDGRTATGAITGENKVTDAGASGVPLTATAVPAGYHVLVAYSNRTGSGDGATFTGGITTADHSAIFDATSSIPNFAAGGSAVAGSTGDFSVTVVLNNDDVDGSISSGVIVALGSV